MSAFTDQQFGTLRALCDTIVPSIPKDDDPHGFWARKASDLGVEYVVQMLIETRPEQQAGVAVLLDVLAAQDFAALSQPSREQTLSTMSMASREAGIGIRALVQLILFLSYAIPPNPNWPILGFPGPISQPPDQPKTINPIMPADGETLEADVVVVGSGAGGGVMAGKLAAAGLSVLVLEMGGYFNEADFNQTELWGYTNLYWRGGPTPTTDLNVSLQAGSCLGGGTVVNWTNCLRTKPWVREEWATEHGLGAIADPAFEKHFDALWARLGVNDECSELNGPQQVMKRGADALGWSWRTADRNWDKTRHDPVMAGYMGWGDQSGAKQSTMKTYLQDAFDAGARIAVRSTVQRVLVEGGRAAGVEAVYNDGERSAAFTVRAPRVVVAAGALESPALLLRSGIGGPAVGDYLRLHPCTAMVGDYGTDMKAWWGAPHAGLIDEFGHPADGYGFLIEATQYTTGLSASAFPFTSAAEHKENMLEARNWASTIGLVRDYGHGRVSLDAAGVGQPSYPMTEPRDIATTRRALAAQARLHRAAGARRIMLLANGMPAWRIGDDLEAFIDTITSMHLGAGAVTLFSAHQMGTCRMGSDPATSVANPLGELHDTPGVWIGDASAFPTPSGTNPMITIMALASATADNLIADAGARATTTALPEPNRQEAPA